jgi:hypothetical protein
MVMILILTALSKIVCDMRPGMQNHDTPTREDAIRRS